MDTGNQNTGMTGSDSMGSGGINEPSTGSEPTQTDPQSQSAPNQSNQGDPTPQGGTSPQQTQQEPSNVAFAKYRVENTQYKDFIGKIADQLGIPGASLEELNSKLDEASAQKYAKDNGINEDLALRIAKMEQSINASTEEQAFNQAQGTLRGIQEEFGETDEGMTNFLNLLGEKNINPYSVDLRTQYIVNNLDRVISKGVDAELQRIEDAKNAPTGSPGASRPQGGGTGGKIESVSELSAIFKNANL